MSGKSKWDYLRVLYVRYKKVSKRLRAQILEEFCRVVRVQWQIRHWLAQWASGAKAQDDSEQRASVSYGAQVIRALTAIWEAAGYPCSARLKGLLPLWLRWAIRRVGADGRRAKATAEDQPGTAEMIPMKLIDLDILKGKSRRQQNSWRPQPRAHGPLTGGCPGKGRCHCVDPGAIVEEIFKPDQPDFQKATDAKPKQQPLLCSHQRTEQTKINRENLQNAGFHFL